MRRLGIFDGGIIGYPHETEEAAALPGPGCPPATTLRHPRNWIGRRLEATETAQAQALPATRPPAAARPVSPAAARPVSPAAARPVSPAVARPITDEQPLLVRPRAKPMVDFADPRVSDAGRAMVGALLVGVGSASLFYWEKSHAALAAHPRAVTLQLAEAEAPPAAPVPFPAAHPASVENTGQVEDAGKVEDTRRADDTRADDTRQADETRRDDTRRTAPVAAVSAVAPAEPAPATQAAAAPPAAPMPAVAPPPRIIQAASLIRIPDPAAGIAPEQPVTARAARLPAHGTTPHSASFPAMRVAARSVAIRHAAAPELPRWLTEDRPTHPRVLVMSEPPHDLVVPQATALPLAAPKPVAAPTLRVLASASPVYALPALRPAPIYGRGWYGGPVYSPYGPYAPYGGGYGGQPPGWGYWGR